MYEEGAEKEEFGMTVCYLISAKVNSTMLFCSIKSNKVYTK